MAVFYAIGYLFGGALASYIFGILISRNERS